MPARMTVLTGRVLACLGVASGLSLGSPAGAADAGLQPDGSFVVGKDASEVIGQYLSKVTGRYGALAISDDGTAAAYYICQSRLWKNCDDYSLDEDVVTIPSGNLAAKLAEK